MQVQTRVGYYENGWGYVDVHTHLSQEAFLPQGYPESVSDDYLAYQIWDTTQVRMCGRMYLNYHTTDLMSVGILFFHHWDTGNNGCPQRCGSWRQLSHTSGCHTHMDAERYQSPSSHIHTCTWNVHD